MFHIWITRQFSDPYMILYERTCTMKKRLKKKWVDALRSGEHQQGTGYLCTSDGLKCCLGVLLLQLGDDVFDPFVSKSVPACCLAPFMLSNKYMSDVEVRRGWRHISSLPASLLDRTGLNREQQSTLIRLNDEDRLTFEQIADWIEMNL